MLKTSKLSVLLGIGLLMLVNAAASAVVETTGLVMQHEARPGRQLVQRKLFRLYPRRLRKADAPEL